MCDNCKNKTICKYVDEYKKVQEQIKNIQITINSPIKVESKCSMFAEKNCQGGYFNNVPIKKYL